jgi:hypothetical protein
MSSCKFLDPLGLRQYIDQGTFQYAVAKMFWVSPVAKFQILIVSYFVGQS